MSTNEDPDFLKKFFANSRLHFIGTWRNRLPQFTKRMMMTYTTNTAVDKPFPSTESRRLVIHVDMDCFFVSVLLRSQPHLADRPVAVAHGYSDGCEISSCNYPARARGIKNGMFMRSAKGLCPELMILPYDFKQYEEVSERIYSIFYSTAGTVIVQPVSVDEAYLEFVDNGKGMEIAMAIRERVYNETRCPCSAGIGPNMLLAKYIPRC